MIRITTPTPSETVEIVVRSLAYSDTRTREYAIPRVIKELLATPEGGSHVIFSFTDDEAQHLASLLRIASNEDARITHNATIQRAEQEALDIIREKLNEQL